MTHISILTCLFISRSVCPPVRICMLCLLASPGETVGAQRVGPPNQVNVDLFGAVVIPCGLVNVSARPNETVRWRLQRVGKSDHNLVGSCAITVE